MSLPGRARIAGIDYLRAGLVPNAPPAGGGGAAAAFPEGFGPRPAPYGVSFTGGACSEPRLDELAYAFEQAMKRRVPPASAP